MVERLCAPTIQWLVARNWNRASSRCALIRSSVANSFSRSTPFRTVSETGFTSDLLGLGLVDDLDERDDLLARHRVRELGMVAAQVLEREVDDLTLGLAADD